jgi:8-oxo-dGTP diphosphatase
MSHNALLHVVAGALIDTDGRVLLAQRPEGKSLAGMWEFPGGKIDPHETPEDALIRELDEELGIELCPTCFAPLSFVSHAYEHFHLLMLLYIVNRWEGIPQSREGQALTWKRPRDMRTLPMPPADLPLIAVLDDALKDRFRT